MFAVPSNDSTCDKCGLVQTLLSVAFLLFTLTVLSALLTHICVIDTLPPWPLWLAQIVLSFASVSFAVGFLIDAVCLIVIGQPEVGSIIIVVVTVFISVTLFQFWRRADKDEGGEMHPSTDF